MSSKQMPPVPPAGRSPKGPKAEEARPQDDTAPKPSPEENTDDRGAHGNIKQNTRNSGYQQAR